MILKELHLMEKVLKTPQGELSYNWKSDLEDEEDNPEYIPKGYKKRVLELSIISVNDPGKGYGAELMKAFLNTKEAKQAELIFLDPNPGIGVNDDSEMSDGEQIQRLQKFYRRFGFRNNPKANRMWLVQKGEIPDNSLPT